MNHSGTQEKIFDPFRNKWVENLPEEKVRQALLKKMVFELGYPKNLLGVEKDLSQIPHLRGKNIPSKVRRVDIICFAKGIHQEFPDLYPLLVIECKAIALTKEVLDQVLGYNHSIQAPFVGVANQENLFLFWKEENHQRSVSFLPSYQELLKSVTR